MFTTCTFCFAEKVLGYQNSIVYRMEQDDK
jgi:hypothetical protein